MIKTKLLNLPLNITNKSEILEYLEKNKNVVSEFMHIVSINSENMMIALKNHEFQRVIAKSYAQIIDGEGVIIAIQLLNRFKLKRTTGVVMMDTLIKYAAKYSLTCLLIGGTDDLAKRVVDCYQKNRTQLKIKSCSGFSDIKNPTKREQQKIKQIVDSVKPCFVFVSFGSPYQEIWINKNKAIFNKSLVMGVGGAFAMLSGEVPRAPKWVQRMGAEWLFRLILQPWRIRRQLKLLQFVYLVFQEKLRQIITRLND